nr:MAG TPA: hypothetical protein [Caudoviricetes sp.]
MLLTKLVVNKNVKLDFLHLEEESDNNADIFNNAKYKPSLSNDSRFLVTFDDATTIARGISDTALGYTFSIYREDQNSNQLKYIAKLSTGMLSISDYAVVNNATYKYYIFKEDDTSISKAVISNAASTCWWDWSLTDLLPSPDDSNVYFADSSSIWKFNLNISSGGITQNMNNTIYQNLTRFPKVSSGKSNYSSGSLTCLLGNIQKSNNGYVEYVEGASLLDEWNKFCANGNIKLMKDRKGNIMLVTITETSSQLDDVLREQVNTITFSWVQVGDASNVTIIGV